MSNAVAYKYDAAFSYLSQDQNIVETIRDRIESRINVFTYTEHQSSMAGADGLDLLKTIYQNEARTAIIFHRDGWGESGWTRIESLAIKLRGIEDGFRSVLILKQDSSNLPSWYPESQFWLDLARFGADAAVGAIEGRVRERGGNVQSETAAHRAARLAKKLKFQKLREATLFSERAVQEGSRMFALLQRKVDGMAEEFNSQHSELRLRISNSRPAQCFDLSAFGFCINVNWQYFAANDVTDASLTLTTIKYDRLGLNQGKNLLSQKLMIDYIESGKFIWRDKNSVIYDVDSLAEFIVKELLGRVDAKS